MMRPSASAVALCGALSCSKSTTRLLFPAVRRLSFTSVSAEAFRIYSSPQTAFEGTTV